MKTVTNNFKEEIRNNKNLEIILEHKDITIFFITFVFEIVFDKKWS